MTDEESLADNDDTVPEDVDFGNEDQWDEYDWEDDRLCSYPCEFCGETYFDEDEDDNA